MIRLIVFVIIGYFSYQYLFGIESGCEKYASNYSCDYVENKASYDVYYWHNVHLGDTNDEKFIGSVVSLQSCKSLAMRYANSIHERWNNRSYICILKKDGKNMEKHRLL